MTQARNVVLQLAMLWHASGEFQPYGCWSNSTYSKMHLTPSPNKSAPTQSACARACCDVLHARVMGLAPMDVVGNVSTHDTPPATACWCTNASVANGWRPKGSVWEPPTEWGNKHLPCLHPTPCAGGDPACGGLGEIELFDAGCPGGSTPGGQHDGSSDIDFERQRMVLLTSASLSVIGTLLIIGSFFLFRDIRFPSREIIMYISVCDLAVSIAFLITGFAPVGGFTGGSEGVSYPNSLCYAQGYLLTFSYLASFLWTACFALHLLGLFSATASSPKAGERGRCQLAPAYHYLSWGLPTAEIVLLLMLQFGSDSFPTVGRSDRFWCWISTYDRSGRTWEGSGAWMQFGLFYIPLSAILLFNTYTYWKLHSKIRNKRTISPDMERAIRTRLQLYLVVFALCSVWGLANRIYSWFNNGDEHAPSHWLDYLEVTFSPLQGFLNSVVYGVNTKVLVLFKTWLREKLGACCHRAGLHPHFSSRGSYSGHSDSRSSMSDSEAEHSSFDERLLSAPVDGADTDLSLDGSSLGSGGHMHGGSYSHGGVDASMGTGMSMGSSSQYSSSITYSAGEEAAATGGGIADGGRVANWDDDGQLVQAQAHSAAAAAGKADVAM